MLRAVACSILMAASTARAQEPATTRVVFDSYMTPAAGAQGLVAIQQEIAALEDRWVPIKVGDERSRRALALGILYRSAKMLMFDVPQDHLLLVVAHEVFGHGARFRELGNGRISYGFDPPIPYGSGDAFTRFSGEFPVSPLANLTVSASGMEAQHALADAVAERAIARHSLHYREAWLYFESRMAALSYILSASPNSSRGHDAADFLDAFEDACKPPCAPQTRNDVQRRALLSLADPMLYYSLYGFAGGYIGGGRTSTGIPMIPFGSQLRVLPSLGFSLAPYGTEWTLRTLVARRATNPDLRPTISNVTARIGTTGAATTWAAGVRAHDLLRLGGLRVGADVNVWRQPELLADQTSAPLQTGIAVGATAILRMPRMFRSPWSDGIHMTGGYKSEGYIPGEQLSGGAFLRAGIAFAR